MQGFRCGNSRKGGKEYGKLHGRHQKYNEALREIWHTLSDEEKKTSLKELKRLRKDFLSVPSKEPMDSGYKRMQYTRYADDFLIGVLEAGRTP